MDIEKKIVELREQGKSYDSIAKALSITKKKVRYWSKKNGLKGFIACEPHTISTESIDKRFNNMYPNFEYIDGYTTCEKPIIIRCRKCGHTFKTVASCLRHLRNMQCPQCNKRQSEIKKQEKKAQQELIKEQREKEKIGREQIKKENFIKTHTKKCIQCGETFIATHNRQKYCSEKCKRRAFDKRKNKRIYKNGQPDLTISLERLIKRDNNICYICGKECNSNDYIIDKENNFIAGADYPSIDHIIPIAKGGLHEWGNVRLAHIHCNTIKRDKLYKQNKNGQLKLWL